MDPHNSPLEKSRVESGGRYRMNCSVAQLFMSPAPVEPPLGNAGFSLEWIKGGIAAASFCFVHSRNDQAFPEWCSCPCLWLGWRRRGEQKWREVGRARECQDYGGGESVNGRAARTTANHEKKCSLSARPPPGAVSTPATSTLEDTQLGCFCLHHRDCLWDTQLF